MKKSKIDKLTFIKLLQISLPFPGKLFIIRGFAILIFIGLFCFQSFAQSQFSMEINQGWLFRKSGEKKWLPATVPGTVHTDLLNNKLIPDPYAGTNEKDLQWIEKEDWEYTTEFDVDIKYLDNNHIYLIFNGLDTYASVYLNNSLVITADNMFRTWKTDVKKLLVNKQNKLIIKFKSAYNQGIEEAKKLKYTLPGDEKVFTRKAAYQYGWDWGPRFVTCGIWKPVRLVAFNVDILEDVHIYTAKIEKGHTKMKAIVELKPGYKGNFSIVITDKSSGKVLESGQKNINTGDSIVSLDFTVDNPDLWWCNGSGKPNLYTFIVELTDVKGNKQKKEIRTGIRTIELKQESGSFCFVLNGKPLFIKGSNYIPPDNFLPRVTIDKYHRIIDNAVMANMNMLRVWGGGVYADDDFLDYCDEKGILVWQDFMFACSMYPGDKAFFENVKQEATDNVKRLRNHPCLALWCGNNEIDEGWNNWDWQKQYRYSKQDSARIWNDYLELFRKILPGVINDYDPTCSYISTSPKTGWGHKESMEDGDSHYWGVWWGMEPFEKYEEKVGRFMSEYGFQGFPDMRTMKSYCKPEDTYLSFDDKKQPVTSEVMKAHQKHPAGYQTIETYMEREYKIPAKFEDYAYVSQLLQAYGIKKAIDAQRFNQGYCMGTLYWQLNDCWPVVSWSSTDCYDRWKALHYFVKKAYRDTCILFRQNKVENQLVVDLNINRLSKTEISKSEEDEVITEKENIDEMEVSVIDFYGKEIFNSGRFINTRTFDINELTKAKDPAGLVVTARLFSGKKNILADHCFLALPKDLVLPKVAVKSLIINTGDGFNIELSSDQLAKNLYLSLDDNDAFFNDNYFDLLPGEKVIVHCKTKLSEELMNKELKFKSLADCY
ncbi:MAG: glycoside hydrolase family 2 protein [Bacteroidia bacterium]|nr:glycoside hydrolase family 2 protein [Bacteroidia bacterium]